MTKAELDALKRALAAFRDAHVGLAALVLHAPDSKAVQDAAWQAIDGMGRAKYEISAIIQYARPGLRGRLRRWLLGRSARLRMDQPARAVTPPPGRDT